MMRNFSTNHRKEKKVKEYVKRIRISIASRGSDFISK